MESHEHCRYRKMPAYRMHVCISCMHVYVNVSIRAIGGMLYVKCDVGCKCMRIPLLASAIFLVLLQTAYNLNVSYVRLINT